MVLICPAVLALLQVCAGLPETHYHNHFAVHVPAGQRQVDDIARDMASSTMASEDDATSRFSRRALKATPYSIVEYNTKMAIKDRNSAVVKALLELSQTIKGTVGRYNSVGKY